MILFWLKKIIRQQIGTGFLTGSIGSLDHPVKLTGFLTSFIFFLNLTRFQPRVSRVPGQPTGRTKFQNYA